MRHDFIDRYSRLESPIHRISAPVKLVAALLTVLLVVTVPISTPVVYRLLRPCLSVSPPSAAFPRVFS